MDCGPVNFLCVKSKNQESCVWSIFPVVSGSFIWKNCLLQRSMSSEDWRAEPWGLWLEPFRATEVVAGAFQAGEWKVKRVKETLCSGLCVARFAAHLNSGSLGFACTHGLCFL